MSVINNYTVVLEACNVREMRAREKPLITLGRLYPTAEKSYLDT